MAISHLIVTKPGPGTINEAIAMKLPILIDNTDKLLFWERINVDLVLRYGVGQRITHPREIEDLIANYLLDDTLQEKLYDSFCSIPPNNFHVKIKGIIADMVATRQCQAALRQTKHSVSLNQAVPHPGL